MNSVGQLVLGPEILQWDTLVDAGTSQRMILGGISQVNLIAGFIECPKHVDLKVMHAYSIETGRLSVLSRLSVRLLERQKKDAGDILSEMTDDIESPFSIRMIASPVNMPNTRKGWRSFMLSGMVTQPVDHKMFRGIFYEFSFDDVGENLVAFPSASPRHYDQGDLDNMSMRELLAAKIWGYDETGRAIG